MHEEELAIPPDALTDPEAFEIMRLWAAHEQLHVTINSDVSGSRLMSSPRSVCKISAALAGGSGSSRNCV